MGAEQHIYLTTQVKLIVREKNINEKDLKKLLPEDFRNDFNLAFDKVFLDKNPLYPNGINTKVIIFSLKNKYLKDINNFIIDFFELVKNESKYYKNDNIYNNFIEEFKNLKINDDILIKIGGVKELSEKLRGIESNFFMDFLELPSFVVYEGFPESLKFNDKNSFLVGFDLLYSRVKFSEDKDEMVFFHKLIEKLKESPKYPILAKNTYLMVY